MDNYSRELSYNGHTFIVTTRRKVLSKNLPPTSELREAGKELLACLHLIYKDILSPELTPIQFVPQATFIGHWVPDPKSLLDIAYGDAQKDLGLLVQLVGEDSSLGTSLRCQNLVNMLMNAQLLNASSTEYTDSVRLAVIQGFLQRAFPRVLKADYRADLPAYTPPIDQAIAMASQLGIYIPVSDLQNGWQRTLLANHFLFFKMRYVLWLCPHCFWKFESAKLRWNHLVTIHKDIFNEHL